MRRQAPRVREGGSRGRGGSPALPRLLPVRAPEPRGRAARLARPLLQEVQGRVGPQASQPPDVVQAAARGRTRRGRDVAHARAARGRALREDLGEDDGAAVRVPSGAGRANGGLTWPCFERPRLRASPYPWERSVSLMQVSSIQARSRKTMLPWWPSTASNAQRLRSNAAGRGTPQFAALPSKGMPNLMRLMKSTRAGARAHSLLTEAIIAASGRCHRRRVLEAPVSLTVRNAFRARRRHAPKGVSASSCARKGRPRPRPGRAPARP